AVIESGGLWFDAPETADHAATDASPGYAQSPVEIVRRLAERDPAAPAAARAVADGGARERAAAARGDSATAAANATLGEPSAAAAWLRGTSAHDVLAAYTTAPSGMIDMPCVVRDGAVLPARDPVAAFATADGWNRVPVLVGTNRDEN